jgi:hypothetical protein
MSFYLEHLDNLGLAGRYIHKEEAIRNEQGLQTGLRTYSTYRLKSDVGVQFARACVAGER